MKYIKWLLLLCSILAFRLTFAQDVNKEQINSGFVFIDGEYVDAPYSIERKGLEIFINGKLAQTYKDKFAGSNENPFLYRVKPEVPDGLNENSNLDDFYNAKDNLKGIPILNTTGYFYLKYPYEEAIDSIAAFIESFPNIQHVKKQGVNKHKIILKNGQETSIFIGVTAEKNANRWGPDGPGKMSKRKYTKTIDSHIKAIEEQLLDDYLLIFTPNSVCQKVSIRQSEKLVLVDSIMHDSSLDDENKTDSLMDIINTTRPSKPFEDFVKNYKTSKQYIDRISEFDFFRDKSGRQELQNLNYKNRINDTKGKSNLEPTQQLDIYSPDNTDIYAWCPYSWDVSFEEFEQDELGQVIDYLAGQDYEYSGNNVFIDNTPNDDVIDFASCTYENLKNMASAGFLYYTSHGSADGYLLIQIASDFSDLSAEFNDALIEISAIDCPVDNDWDNNFVCFGAFVNYEFFLEYWQQPLTESNAVVMVSVCYGGTNNLIESYGGAFAMSYSNQVEWNVNYENFTGIEYNNYHFLRRMNGKVDGGQYRRAVEAFNNMPNPNFEPCYNMNSEVTLCPATVDYTFGEVDNSGVGFFEVDSWCNSGVPVTYALNYIVTGDVSFISEPHWVYEQNGKSKRIEYEWDGHNESFEIEFELNPDFFQSWGISGDNEYHRLAFDREMPIEETPITYSIWRDAPSDVDFYADNNNIPEGSSVYFTNTTNIENITSYLWDFGDGTTSTLESPSHIYNAAGVYDVELTVTTEWDSYNHLRSNYIHVFDESSGDIECSSVQSTLDDKTVVFDVFFNGYNDESYTYKYHFSFGDGQSEEVVNNVAFASITHPYDEYSTYNPSVVLRIFNIYDEEVFYGGCSCPVVTLTNPDPCADFSLSIAQSPSNPAYLNFIPNSSYLMDVDVSFTGEVSGGTPPYHWYWAFLSDEFTGIPPVGGETADAATTTFISQSLGTATYNSSGDYSLFVSVMDANGCLRDPNKTIEVRSPTECISNIEIQNYDEKIQYKRIIIPKDRDDCFFNFRYMYKLYPFSTDDNSSSNICWNCINSSESYQWKINGVNTEYHKDLLSPLSQGLGFFDQNKQLECYSSSLTSLSNNVSVSVWGRPGSGNSSTSCSRGSSITIVRPDCTSITNTYDFVNFQLSSYNLIRLQPTYSDMHEYISGYFELNSHVNTIIDEKNTILTACNGIVLQNGFETGESYFIAQVQDFNDNCYTTNKEKLSTCDSEDSNDTELYLRISPNPITKSFSISLFQTTKGNALIQILNSEGRLIKIIIDDILEEGDHTIFVEDFNFPAGLYLCKYTFNGTVLSEKIIKHR